MPQYKISLQPRPTQIDVPVPEASGLVGFVSVIIERERRRFRRVQDRDGLRQYFNLPARQIGIYGPVGPGPYGAGYLQHIFRACLFRDGEGFANSRIRRNLHKAGSVPQVYKYQPAVISSSLQPPSKCDSLTDIRQSQLTAVLPLQHNLVFRSSIDFRAKILGYIKTAETWV